MKKSIQDYIQVEVHIMGSTWKSIMNVAWFILAFEFINCPSKVTLTWHVKWSHPRQCICKLSIKSYLWHAMKMAVLIKTNELKDIDSDINRLTDTFVLSVTQSLSEPSRWDFLSDPGGRRWRWSWRWKWVDSLKLKLSRSWSSDWLLGEILS